MTQRYVAPIQTVSVQPESPRYTVQEDRRKPVAVSVVRRPYQPGEGAAVGSSRRDFRALALLVLAVALAVVVALSLLV